MTTPSPAIPAMGANPLDQLADIHLPPPVPNFPWAPGWWVLLLVTICLVAGSIWLWRRYRQGNAYRRAAQAELSALNTIADDAEFARQLNQLLRRVAIHCQTRSADIGTPVAGLSGEQWRDFLMNSCAHKAAFRAADLEELASAAYQRRCSALDRQQLLAQAQRWIRYHRSHYV